MKQDFHKDVTVTSKGQLTLPVSIRKALKLGAKRKVRVAINQEGLVTMQPLPDVMSFYGALKGTTPFDPREKAAKPDRRWADVQWIRVDRGRTRSHHPCLPIGRANVLLRFLRNDQMKWRFFTAGVAGFIQRANEGSLILDVSAVTVAEVFYALKAAYHVDRRLAARTLAHVLNTPAFRLSNRGRVLDALAAVSRR